MTLTDNDAGLNAIELVGTVKWFDPGKGFGFLTSDDVDGDVLIHITSLRGGGFKTAYEGAKIRCLAAQRKNGIQVFQVLSMDESDAVFPWDKPSRSYPKIAAESEWERVICKWFNRVRGFGFLSRGDGTEDIYVHMETLRRGGFTGLRPGQFVQVRWARGPKGVIAAEVLQDGVPGAVER